MTHSTDHRWLHRFAVMTAAATFCLIWVGGLVTSHGAGMAVPDWPTTYGYNMFFFPFSKWVGGIFYEHTHRLVAVLVGGLTSILAAWIWSSETKGRSRWAGLAVIVALVGMLGHRGSGQSVAGAEYVPLHFHVLALVMPVLMAVGIIQLIRNRGALRWLAMIAFFAVILQGVLGGLRVVQMKDFLGVFHATLAQLFFGLVSAIALFTSRWWLQPDQQKMSVYAVPGLRYLFATVTGLILLQLMLGAAMRHQHAGLAIPDFPLAYGKVWPAMDAESVAGYNQARGELTAANPITSLQIGLQMTHRIVALLILLSVAWAAGASRRRAGAQSVLAKLSITWLALVLAQAALGAATIWTNKAADLATAHVAVGALSLMNGVMLVLTATRLAKREQATASSARTVMGLPRQSVSATS